MKVSGVILSRFKTALEMVLSSFLPAVGIGLIALSLFADKLHLGKSYSKTMGPLEKICLACGILTIVLWLIFRKHSFLIGTNLAVFFILILILDPILYYMSPWLPLALVGRMSPAAEDRYAHFHKGHERYIYYNKKAGLDPADYCYEDAKGQPNYSGFEFVYTFQYDEFGYRNPPGYILKNEADVLLVGDSFTEGIESAVTIADYLRKYLSPLVVYSTGVCNAGPWQYMCQYRNYMKLKNPHKKPQYVIVNLYDNDFYAKRPGDPDPRLSWKKRKSNKNNHLIKNITGNNNLPAAQTNQDNTLEEQQKNKFFLNPQDHVSRLPFKNEPFIIFEHYLEENLVKIVMHPKKHLLLNKLLVSMGINQKQWQLGMRHYGTQPYDEIDWDTFNYELTNIFDEVREQDPETHIIVSFIPSVAETCDVRIREENPSLCAGAFSNQQKMSARVKEICQRHKITYVDITPRLKEFAAGLNQSIYMWNSHLNLYGYDLYAQFLAEQIPHKK